MTDSTNTVRLSTGNEYISVPDISADSASIRSIGFMHSAFRACVELRGSEDCPFLAPVLEVEGEDCFAGDVRSEMVSFWMPRFTLSREGVNATATIVAPLERRGFVCVLTIENTTDRDVTVKAGWRGCWETTYHTANVSRPMSGVKHASVSSWKPGVPIIEYRGHTPLFAVALAPGEVVPTRIWSSPDAEEINEWTGEPISARPGSPVHYELADRYTLAPSEVKTLHLYVGAGLDEVSAAASSAELQVQGWERLMGNLKTWLDAHTIDCQDGELKTVINRNSFYNYFYSQAITLDREEFVITTARSSRNESCSAYWDRDAMMWSLPGVLQIDWSQARKMLIYAFTTQLRNVGTHSRFIDGIVLEPGLALDQLCAPIKALQSYVELTDDMSILFDRRVQTGVNAVQQVLGAQRHPDVALFETLLLPSGEPSRYPYVCYSNVLVWRVLLDLASIYDRIRDMDRAEDANRLAESVRQAIGNHFIVPGPYGDMFARAVDLEGGFELGDDAGGSLQLLSCYGFCSPDDRVYENTLAWIFSEHNPGCASGSPSAPACSVVASGPSVLGAVNDLLTGRRTEAIGFLRGAKLDDGIACETVDCAEGRGLTGCASAAIAGYLAYGLRVALNAKLPESSSGIAQRRPGDALYQPPTETVLNARKARL